jgi:hypothetical protein
MIQTSLQTAALQKQKRDFGQAYGASDYRYKTL